MIVHGIGTIFLKTVTTGKRWRIYRQSLRRGCGEIKDGRIDIESVSCPENAAAMFYVQGENPIKDKNRLHISPSRLNDIFYTLVFAENYQISRNITL